MRGPSRNRSRLTNAGDAHSSNLITGLTLPPRGRPYIFTRILVPAQIYSLAGPRPDESPLIHTRGIYPGCKVLNAGAQRTRGRAFCWPGRDLPALLQSRRSRFRLGKGVGPAPERRPRTRGHYSSALNPVCRKRRAGRTERPPANRAAHLPGPDGAELKVPGQGGRRRSQSASEGDRQRPGGHPPAPALFRSGA